MRISLARCALIVPLVVVLVGCKSSESTWHSPSWSLSSLNPFSSSSDESAYPAKPSDLATSPTPTMSPAAGYAAASSAATTPGRYPTTSASGFPSSQYSPTTWSNPLAGTLPSAGHGDAAPNGQAASPATSPQNGYYDPQARQGTAGESGTSSSGSQYSWNTGIDAYGSAGTSGYSSTTNSDYIPSVGHGHAPPNGRAAVTGAYGQAATATPRYSVPSERYGLNGAARDNSNDFRSRQGTVADPYASVRDHNSQYTSNLQGLAAPSGGALNSVYGTPADSRYAKDSHVPEIPAGDSRYSSSGSSDSRYPNFGSSDYGYGAGSTASGATGGSSPVDTGDSGSRYQNASRYGSGSSSPVSDRYARAYNSFSNGQLSNSSGDTGWDPGDTGYRPGGPTDNMPGRTDYQPGNTGYNPPGISPYRSPAASYTAPSNAVDVTNPYLPGSTKLYAPPRANSSDTSEQTPSTARPKTDSHVVPASHSPLRDMRF